jgi:hypothetical protein
MARRVLLLSLIAGMAVAAAAFAAGQKDAGTQAPVATTGQKVTVTGPVSFTNLIHPTLKAGDKVYALLVPRHLIWWSGIKEGATVSIEGYQATGLPPWADIPDGTTPVYVTKATIDGKEYDLSQLGGGMMGGRGGPGYGRGPGSRGMMGGGGMGYGWTY